MKAFLHVYDILAELAPHAKSYLGIGIQEGGCVERVVRANPSIDLILCDTWGPVDGGSGRGSHAHIEELLRRSEHAGHVRFLDGDSKELVPALEAHVDLSYVDGDHSEEGAFVDLMNAWQLTDFAMVAHDMTTPSVVTAFWRFLKLEQEGEMTFHLWKEREQATAVLYRRLAH